MGTIIIKPEREKDEYVLWSTGTNGPWAIGSRAETIQLLLEDSDLKPEFARGQIEARLQRTDERGTSELIGHPSWEKEETWIYAQLGVVKRSDVGTLAHLLLDGGAEASYHILALLEPLEW